MSEKRSVTDVTCLRCGCTCDDLQVSLEGNRIADVQRVCELGRDWFMAAGQPRNGATALLEGRPVESKRAIEQAATILAASKAPLIWGLTHTVTETVRASLALADLAGARVVLDRSELELGRVAAFQDFGGVTATLGEVKNRADVVLFWGVDPVTTHPRHFERYSVDPIGRFVPRGRAGRKIVVVDSRRTATADVADLYIEIESDRHVEAFTALRMLLRGKPIDAGSLPRELDLSTLTNLIEVFKAAHYGAMFYEASAASGGSGFGWEGAIRLVRDLNEFTRFVLLGLGSPGNLDGAESALVWQSGYLQGVDYRLGRPIPLDRSATLEELLHIQQVDAVVAVDNFPTDLSAEAGKVLGSIATIAIGPAAVDAWQPTPTVAFSTATVGFDVAGSVIRSDGVVLPLRPILPPTRPSDREWIEAITSELKLRKQGAA